MNEKRFRLPVRVKSPSNGFIVATAWEAVEYLKRSRPSGREYHIALQHCLYAVDRLKSVRAAQTFLVAAGTAGLLV